MTQIMEVDQETGEVRYVEDKKKFKPWFSASLIKDYDECGAKAYARITKQPQVNPSFALIKGTSVHRGMELFLKEERDPVKVFNETFQYEAEKQKLSTKGDFEENRAEGELLTIKGRELMSAGGFNKTVDPKHVEVGFKIERNGRMYVGKLDLLHVKQYDPMDYYVVDFKTGKNVPKQYALDWDIQFTMYPWAAKNDASLPTFGFLPTRAVWFHLRGKNVGIDPETGQTARKEKYKKYQYDFPTVRTEEQIEQQFAETIEPIAELIEEGKFRRKRSEDCLYCSYFDKTKNACTVDMPMDNKDSGVISLLDQNFSSEHPKAA